MPKFLDKPVPGAVKVELCFGSEAVGGKVTNPHTGYYLGVPIAGHIFEYRGRRCKIVKVEDLVGVAVIPRGPRHQPTVKPEAKHRIIAKNVH